MKANSVKQEFLDNGWVSVNKSLPLIGEEVFVKINCGGWSTHLATLIKENDNLLFRVKIPYFTRDYPIKGSKVKVGFWKSRSTPAYCSTKETVLKGTVAVVETIEGEKIRATMGDYSWNIEHGKQIKCWWLEY